MSDLRYLTLPDTVLTVQFPLFWQVSSPQTDSTQLGAKYPRRHLKAHFIDVNCGQLTKKLIFYASHLFLNIRNRTCQLFHKIIEKIIFIKWFKKFVSFIRCEQNLVQVYFELLFMACRFYEKFYLNDHDEWKMNPK